LGERQVEKLREVARKYGWADIPQGCEECNACPNGHAERRTDPDELSSRVDEAINRFLRS
jgi:hypothetical protein